MTASVWIALVALVVSVSQAIVQTARYYRNRAKADLSAHGLQRHVTTPWSIEKSRGGPIQKDTPDEIVVVNHGPHQATEITVQLSAATPGRQQLQTDPGILHQPDHVDVERVLVGQQGTLFSARFMARDCW